MLHNVSPQSYTFKSYEKGKTFRIWHADTKISKKIKTTWDIINIESGRKVKKCRIQSLNVEGKNTEHHQIIVDLFSKYFITIAANINTDIDLMYIGPCIILLVE